MGISQRLSSGRLAVFVVGFFVIWAIPFVAVTSIGAAGSLSYWIAVKMLIFVWYPWLFWRERLAEQLDLIGANISSLRRGLLWGITATGIWLTLNGASAALMGLHLQLAPLTLRALYLILFVPVVEEVFFRGYVQSALLGIDGSAFRAIFTTSLLFTAFHFVGWSFQGSLMRNLHTSIPENIFLLGLLLGFVRHRSGSLMASIILHAANNAVSVMLFGGN
ncbi:MAG TPA: CPBP family intramembrane glutamic endopeptidase [Lacunisphaera sp.]